MMEVAAHVWRKKISSGLIRWLCLYFPIRDWPRPCYYIKNDNNKKPKKLEIQNVEVFLIVRVVLDDACRVGIFPTFCRPFETRWCSDFDYANVRHVTRTCGAWKWSAILERRNKNGRIPWTSNLFHWDDLWVPSALQRHTLGRFPSRKIKKNGKICFQEISLPPSVSLMFSSLGAIGGDLLPIG